MRFLNTGLKGVTRISTCIHCHFEIIGDGVKWYCDSNHPEIIEQLEKESIRQKENKEIELWYCKVCYEEFCSKCGKCHTKQCSSYEKCIS